MKPEPTDSVNAALYHGTGSETPHPAAAEAFVTDGATRLETPWFIVGESDRKFDGGTS